MSFTGKYPGECGDCGEQTKGTEVEFDGTNTLVHVICPEAVPDKPVAVCPSCFLALPLTGVCGDCDG
jgi:hypothetical protein